MSDNENTNIESVKVLLADARERIKEAEERSSTKIKELEARLNSKLIEIETQFNSLNLKMIEWLPLITNLSKAEDNKRNMSIALIVALISNICAWVLTIFIYFIKSGGKAPGN